MKRPRPILANRLYCPESLVADTQLDRFVHRWTQKVYRDVLDDDGMRVMGPDGKPEFETTKEERSVQSYRELLTGLDPDWLGLPRGDLGLVEPWASQAVDLRSVAPLGFSLKLGRRVRQDSRWPDQRRCVAAWMRQGSGLLIGQTGAGKTVLGVAATCRLGLQTLIVSKRGEGERHWEREFRQHTNIKQLEKQLGRRLIGPYKHRGGYPISIVTVQTFLHETGYRRLLRDQFRFGLVIADEIHELVAPQFIRVFGLWAPLCWLGLTATLERPDHREFLAQQILGPVAATMKADQMRPKVEFIETQFWTPDWMLGQVPYSPEFMWSRVLKLMIDREDRNALIVDRVVQDLNNGRLVAVVGQRKRLLRKIHQQLTDMSYDVAYADGDVPTWRRDQIYADVARRVKYQGIVAGKVLDAMVSIKPLDCMHIITPLSKKHQVMQIFGRARRPLKGKPVPLIRYYVDKGGQLQGAAKNVVKFCNQEGWEIKHTAAALSRRTVMSQWKSR